MRATARLRRSAIGRLARRVETERLRVFRAPIRRANWRRDPAITGGGILMDHGWRPRLVCTGSRRCTRDRGAVPSAVAGRGPGRGGRAPRFAGRRGDRAHVEWRDPAYDAPGGDDGDDDRGRSADRRAGRAPVVCLSRIISGSSRGLVCGVRAALAGYFGTDSSARRSRKPPRARHIARISVRSRGVPGRDSSGRAWRSRSYRRSRPI